jgi:hypothetical protein
MIRQIFPLIAAMTTLLVVHAQGPQGPFPPDQWPGSIDKTKTVHYVSVGDAFAPPAETWITGNMSILSGGDQVTTPIKIGGFDGLKATGNYLNTADNDFSSWAEEEEIDILVQVYGDGALFNTAGEPRNFPFLMGTLPELAAPSGGQIPVEARNRQWNWVLFRVPNGTRGSDGSRFVGSIPANAQGATAAGGVNGGTLRMEGVPNLIVRVIAFGQKGAFGELEQVNQFAKATECPAEPDTNRAWLDISKNQSDHMQLADAGDQKVVFEDNVGPANDKRRAVRPSGAYMNFPVTENFLGAACRDPRAVKVCVEFYDDPALAGKTFGPEAYATDDKGGIGFVAASRRQTLKGTGRWIKRSWTVPAVSLFGVNVAPLTAGPRFFFEEGAPVAISRFELGIFRAGNHPLAGQDPLPECFEDPDWCTYGTFAEMDLATGKLDGLAPGSSGGDQEMIQEEGGPATDRRNGIRPARGDGSAQFQHIYLNFAITDEKLGPTSQPGVKLAICMTYYDDPNLVGAQFRPEVYISDKGGVEGFAFTGGDIAVRLEGTDTWRDAYFEINDVKFIGVNQGPQAAARFYVSDKIVFSKVRYGVIRPCDPNGVNPLASCKPVIPPVNPEISFTRNADGSLKIIWASSAADFALEQSQSLTAPNWMGVAEVPVVAGDQVSVTVKPSGSTYYRLRK